MNYYKKIAIIPGKFQILTNGHIKLFKEAIEKDGNDLVYVFIAGKQEEPSEKNPVPLSFRAEMLQKAAANSQVKVVKAIDLIPAGIANLDVLGDYIVKDLDLSPSKGKSLITFYCGSDRSYADQLKYFNGFEKDGVDKTKGKKDVFQAEIKILKRDESKFDSSDDETYKSSVAKNLIIKYFTTKDQEALNSLRPMLPGTVFEKIEEYWTKYLSKVYKKEESIINRMFYELNEEVEL
jgi:cytidyltransferase-like protein